MEPQDTTIEVEGAFSLRGTARDAGGRPIPGVTIGFAAQTPNIIELGSEGQVIGVQVGLTIVTASAGAVVATATIRVRTKVLVFDIPAPRLFAEVYDVDDAGTIVGALYGRGIPEPFLSGSPPSLTLLPPLGPNLASQARAINSSGVIVGYSTSPDQQSFRLVTWTTGGTITDLGQVGLTRSIGIDVTAPGAILVNHDRDPGTGPVEGASVRAPNGGLTAIPSLTGDNGYFLPTGMASSGAVIGISRTVPGATSPVIWRAGSGTEAIAALPRDAFPASIATGDRVVGFTDPAQPRAFFWTPAAGLQLLGTLGGTASVARGINDAGIVVGAAQAADGYYHAFMWTPSAGMVDLGLGQPGPTEAWAISPNGVVAGLLYPNTNPVPGTQTGPNRVILWINRRRS